MHPSNTALQEETTRSTAEYVNLLERTLEQFAGYLQRHTNSLVERDYKELRADTAKGMKDAKNMRDRQLKDYAGKDMDDMIEAAYQATLKRLQRDLENFRIKHHIPDHP